MNDLYSFGSGVYGFQNVMDPVLESELRKCKTQKERDEVLEAYKNTMLLSFLASMVLGAILCGVIALFM